MGCLTPAVIGLAPGCQAPAGNQTYAW